MGCEQRPRETTNKGLISKGTRQPMSEMDGSVTGQREEKAKLRVCQMSAYETKVAV